MKVGRYGMAWGVIVLIVGWATAFAAFGGRIQAGYFEQARIALVAPLTDLLFFAPVLAAAWIYRRRPEIHKRLIVVATTTLLIAAAHRAAIFVFGGPPPPLAPVLALWLTPILVGMIHDFVKRRTVHPIYLLGIGLVLVMKFGRGWIHRTESWNDFTSWLTTFYV
jgi:hypothetical protein